MYLLITARSGERGHKGAGAEGPRPEKRHARASCTLDQEARRINLAVKTPEPASKTSAPTDSRGARGIPPVSGNSFDGVVVALLVALNLGAEALDIAVVEALEAGLAIMLGSIPILL